ncbi:PspC domain-containing protein [Lawsonibacter celer]|jgi:phage shock protein C|uniref:PspC domain-containing protein n=1 Tax=Lawsonibacter celer TaxID=2986526 RepID=UPI00164965AE|nr:PspC domain-containing protein [Lawsonibacter celer]
MNEPKKLYRIEQGAKLTGVCGGVAEYFNIDANIVRLIWVIVTLCSVGAGLILYIVASVLLPKKSDVYPGY